jgi:ribonuclease HII
MRPALAALHARRITRSSMAFPCGPFPIPQTALIAGDCRSFSIAAASVIAKVTRDRLMTELDATFPEYGFAQHKGYCTPLHLERLKTHGPCAIHRRSFLPVRQTEFPFA